MGRTEQEPSATAAPPPQPAERGCESYEPPGIDWEEEFAPVADSICIRYPGSPGCE